MRYKGIIQRMQSLTAGGIINDENRFDEPYLIAVLNTYRAYVIDEDYTKTKSVDSSSYQSHICTKIVGYGNECFTFASVPSIINIGAENSGINYLGAEDGSYSYRLTTNRGSWANKQRNRITKNRTGKVACLYDAPANMFQIDDNQITRFQCDAIFSNPFEVNTYNPDLDDYPLNDTLIDKILDYLQRGTLRYVLQVPVDKKSNSIEDSQLKR